MSSAMTFFFYQRRRLWLGWADVRQFTFCFTQCVAASDCASRCEPLNLLQPGGIKCVQTWLEKARGEETAMKRSSAASSTRFSALPSSLWWVRERKGFPLSSPADPYYYYYHHHHPVGSKSASVWPESERRCCWVLIYYAPAAPDECCAAVPWVGSPSDELDLIN